MAKETLRKVQPAHASEKFTVAQAERAWQKAEEKTRTTKSAKTTSGRASQSAIRSTKSC